MPFPLRGRSALPKVKVIGLDAGPMNALIFVLILAFAPGFTEASAASVWLFLVVVEWLADRFAGWLWRHWVAHWSALRMRGMVHAISARWG